MNAEELPRAFYAAFGTAPRLFRAPGRVNLIGEHTDYNMGLALAGAIDRACMVAIAPAPHTSIEVIACNKNAHAMIDWRGPVDRGWPLFVAGAARVLHGEEINVGGAQMMIRSDTPEGAGVSSSAALSVATVLALSTLAGAPLQKLALARAAQKVEREHVGVPCGLMDQWASACGEAGQLLAMDFLTQQSEPVVVPANLALLIIDSGVRHANDDGAYAAVARACQDAAAALGVEHLRNAADFDRLEAPLRDKALYVRDENARVTAMAAALKSNDARTAGAILSASHQDLKRRFGVVVDATDRLAMLARSEPGVFGARQMGAGFGGSVVALCAAGYASDSLSRILDRYCADERARANSFVARLGPGAGEVAT